MLVTHGVGFLHHCDRVISMDEGSIKEVGTYAELIDNDGAFAEFIRTYANTEPQEEGDPGNYCSSTSSIVVFKCTT